MRAWSIVLAVAWATSACSDAIPTFIPPPDPELQFWFWETAEIPHDLMTARVEADGVAREILGPDLLQHHPRFYQSRELQLAVGQAVGVRFALVTMAHDTVARWEFDYVTAPNVRQIIEFSIQPDDPCPSFTCGTSELVELSPRAGAAPGDRLWAKVFSTCIDCRGVGIF